MAHAGCEAKIYYIPQGAGQDEPTRIIPFQETATEPIGEQLRLGSEEYVLTHVGGADYTGFPHTLTLASTDGNNVTIIFFGQWYNLVNSRTGGLFRIHHAAAQ